MSYYPGYSGGDSCVVSNNTISIANMTSSYYGMSMYYPRGVNVAHNSINILGASSSSYCLGMNGGGISNTVVNNICENRAGGYTLYYDDPNSVSTSNYNNLRTNGAQFGYYNYNVVASFSQWKSN